MDNTKQKTAEEILETLWREKFTEQKDYSGSIFKAAYGDIVTKAMEVYASQYQHPVPDASQPAGTETYLIYNNDKVNSMLSVALKNLDNEQLEVLRDCLIERTPQPAGNGWLEQINDIMWNSYCIKDKSFGRAEGEKIMQILNDWAKTTS